MEMEEWNGEGWLHDREKAADEREKKEGKRGTMQTRLFPPRSQLLPLLSLLHRVHLLSLFLTLHLPRSPTSLVFLLHSSISLAALPSRTQKKPVPRLSVPLSRSVFDQFLVLYQVAVWNAGVLRSLRAASNRWAPLALSFAGPSHALPRAW